METLRRVYLDLKKWDPSGTQNIKSFVWLKAEDRRKRYIQRKEKRPTVGSLEAMREEGIDIASDAPDPWECLDRTERVAAVTTALTQMDIREQKFLRAYSTGYSPVGAVAYAGYPSGESPQNIIRRVKRKFGSLLSRQPYFAADAANSATLDVSVGGDCDE
ncbi:MAG TPA: hypothetical protein VMX94_00480 [Armatimonadota bacterium]|nr:hypothetical protein [Armatimonadota bacterium]